MADEIASGSPVEVLNAAVSQVEPVGSGSTILGEPVEKAAAPEPLDPDYVSRAKNFNLTEDDLRAVPRDTVERMIAGADRQMIVAQRQENQYQQNNGHQNGNGKPTTQIVNPQPGDFAFDSFEMKFDGDVEADNPLVKNMVALHQHHLKQIEKLHEYYGRKVGAIEQFRDQSVQQSNNSIVDRFVDAQGAQWAEVFGKGPTSDLNTQSQEFLNREEVWTAANAMVQRSAAQGRRLSLAEALPRARNAMFMEKAFAIERAKASEKRTQLEAGATDRPKSPGGVPTPMTIKDKALRLREAAARA